MTTRDGVRIHYYESKPNHESKRRAQPQNTPKSRPRNPTLLFVPGLMTPAWIWEHQLAHFARTHRVVAMDPRSQGQSSKPADGHYPAARARDIKSVVDQLKLKPVVLVAYTSAVTEAASYVDQFGAETLAGLVLVNGIAGREYDEATLSGLLAFSNSFQLDRKKATDRFVRGLFK
ncbi:MAG: alpha/beta fold hydrolase, partial [Gammaproteobacteria bacterium]